MEWPWVLEKPGAVGSSSSSQRGRDSSCEVLSSKLMTA
jgi:hypothetical protein